jgi:hypothetical protein
MTMTTRDELITEVEGITMDLRDVQERFASLVERVRSLPGGELVWQRIEAYPGVRLDRDMGGGQDALGWIEEVAEFLEGAKR